jgi:hypothetical protein
MKWYEIKDNLKMPAVKGHNGAYHVAGDLTIAAEERQFEMSILLSPLLDLVRDHRLLFISPILRYVTGGCCANLTHIPNRVQRGYRQELTQKLLDLKKKQSPVAAWNFSPELYCLSTGTETLLSWSLLLICAA